MKFIELINVKMPTIVGILTYIGVLNTPVIVNILTYIGMLNTTSESLKAK